MLDAGELPHPVHDVGERRRSTIDAAGLIAHVDPGGQDPPGIEARIDIHQPDKAGDEESRSDEQHHRERDLEHHEAGADAPLDAAFRCAPAAILQPAGQVDA